MWSLWHCWGCRGASSVRPVTSARATVIGWGDVTLAEPVRAPVCPSDQGASDLPWENFCSLTLSVPETCIQASTLSCIPSLFCFFVLTRGLAEGLRCAAPELLLPWAPRMLVLQVCSFPASKSPYWPPPFCRSHQCLPGKGAAAAGPSLTRRHRLAGDRLPEKPLFLPLTHAV